MSDGSPITPQLDARMLADLRAWRARRDIDPARVTLTIDEVDMLLRVADERDALKREACAEPGEVIPLRWPATMIAAHGHDGAASDAEREACRICSGIDA
jgi:hypothetical protein